MTATEFYLFPWLTARRFSMRTSQDVCFAKAALLDHKLG